MPILDALTTTEDAVIARLNQDATLASYNWQRWESDVNLVQPRGYVNVEQASELSAAEGPDMMRVEVVLEGKPMRGSLASVVAILRGMLGHPLLHTQLTALVADGSLTFYAPSEQLSVRQTIEGDLRVRRATFVIAALWKVSYV